MEQGQLNIHFGLGGDDRNRMMDTDVVNFFNDDDDDDEDDDVNPDRVTRIDLQCCKFITYKALTTIADTCHNLT